MQDLRLAFRALRRAPIVSLRKCVETRDRTGAPVGESRAAPRVGHFFDASSMARRIRFVMTVI